METANGLTLDFDAVDAAIRTEWDSLAEAVRLEIPSVRWRHGSVLGGKSVFTYCVFDRLDGIDDDPVLAGVRVEKFGRDWFISGDISGEESGEFYFHDEDRHECVATSPNAVRVARRMAASVSEGKDNLIAAIRDRAYRPPDDFISFESIDNGEDLSL